MNGFKSLRDNRSTRDKFKLRIIGGLKGLEVKKGKHSGQWHPHLHCLLVHPPEFEKDYNWIKPAWKEITNGEGSIEIHTITKRKNQTFGIFGAILEVTKYITSPSKTTLNEKDFPELYRTLKKRRSKDTFGVLRGLNKKIDEAVDQDEKEKDIIDFICRLCQCEEYEFEEFMTEFLLKNDIVVYD